jgi:hypothetical protein
VSLRRVTGAQERELLAVAELVERAKAALANAIAERDQLIADLIEQNARVSDIAEILQLTPKAIRDARERARQR